MKNYHYYLKQEIRPHSTFKRFVSINWHPEHPMTLYIVGDGQFGEHLR